MRITYIICRVIILYVKEKEMPIGDRPMLKATRFLPYILVGGAMPPWPICFHLICPLSKFKVLIIFLCFMSYIQKSDGF